MRLGPRVCRECHYGLFTIDLTRTGWEFTCANCQEKYTVMELAGLPDPE